MISPEPRVNLRNTLEITPANLPLMGAHWVQSVFHWCDHLAEISVPSLGEGIIIHISESQSHSVTSDCNPKDYTVHRILQARILEQVGSLSLLQVIFQTQGSNPGLPHCKQILCQLSHMGSLYSHKGFNKMYPARLE